MGEVETPIPLCYGHDLGTRRGCRGCAGCAGAESQPAGQTRTNRACFSDDARAQGKLPQIIISSYHHINETHPMLEQHFKTSLATFWRIQPIVPGFVRILIRFAQIPGRSAEFAQKWNLKRLKNREDGSDFDDFWTKSMAPTQSKFSKMFAPLKKFSRRRRPRRIMTLNLLACC